jgi:hypothetical protein
MEIDPVATIALDLWLYGTLAKYGGPAQQGGFANVPIRMEEQSTMGDVLAALDMPSEARGVTFINGRLSAMPGLQPDLDHILCDGDRIAFFDLRSMWPFQYRQGVPMIGEMAEAMQAQKNGGLHHTYKDDG